MITATENLRREIVALLPRLRRFGRTLTRDRDDADDLVQIAVERALLRADQWQPATRLELPDARLPDFSNSRGFRHLKAPAQPPCRTYS